MRAAIVNQAVFRATIEQRILRLVAGDGDVCIDDLLQAWNVEIGHAQARDLAGPAQAVEFAGGLDMTRHVIVPPMKLDHVDPLHPQAGQGAINDPFDVAAIDRRKVRQVGDEFCMDLNFFGMRRVGLAETADQFFDASINVGAVEGGDPRLDEGGHVGKRLATINGAVVAGQMPAPLDDPGYIVVCGQRAAGNRHSKLSGSTTAVVSARRKARRAPRVIRNRVGQLGSGQATSASLLIQSRGAVSLCLAGSKGSKAARE